MFLAWNFSGAGLGFFVGILITAAIGALLVFKGGALLKNLATWDQTPESVKKVVKEVSQKFFKEFDNPIYSLDFGLEKEKPYIFEVNDQIGFPLPDAKGKDNFLNELIDNFKSKIT